jgi:hypothetical protein
MTLKTAYKNELSAHKNYLVAAEGNDNTRTELAKKVWADTQRELAAARMPPEGLKTGAGGEIIPPACLGMSGLESALKKPDLLSVEATIQRAALADKSGVFDLAFDAAESVSAKNSIEQMLCHQMAAAHQHSMRLLAESEKEKDPQWSVKKAALAARLMDAYSRAALTLQRLRTGPSQSIVVQQVQVGWTNAR